MSTFIQVHKGLIEVLTRTSMPINDLLYKLQNIFPHGKYLSNYLPTHAYPAPGFFSRFGPNRPVHTNPVFSFFSRSGPSWAYLLNIYIIFLNLVCQGIVWIWPLDTRIWVVQLLIGRFQGPPGRILHRCTLPRRIHSDPTLPHHCCTSESSSSPSLDVL